LDLGKKIHIIWLEIGYDASNAFKTVSPAERLVDDVDVSAADQLIGEIRLLVNGKVQRRVRGRELDILNILNGSQYGATSSGTLGLTGYRVRLPIYLAEPWRKSNAEAAIPAWNLSGANVASASIEVDFLTIDTPYINGWYEWSPADGGLGAITKWIRQTWGASGTRQDFNTLEKRDYYHSIHLFPPTGAYVDKVQLTADGVIVQDLLTAAQNGAMLTNRDMAPDLYGTSPGLSPRFDVILDADDPLNSALLAQGLQEFTLHVEYSAAATGNLVAIVQRTGPPE
jgi:hypothetical protein